MIVAGMRLGSAPSKPRREPGTRKRPARHLAVPLLIAAVALLCASQASAAEWRLGGAKLTESISTSWHGSIKVNVSGAAVECEAKAEGSVSTGVGGEITKATVSKCAGVTPCEAGSTIEVGNLPWHTELVISEGVTHDIIEGGGGGEPIYNETCYLAKTPVLYKCTPAEVNTNTSNGSGGVTATFVNSKTIDCNGKTVGSIEGSQTIESSNGSGALSAVNASEASKLAEAQWRLSGAKLAESISTSWHGKITVSDNGAAVECEDTAEGSVSAGVGGEVKYATMSKCAGAKTCEAGSTIEAGNLPWHTELVTSEGVTHDVIVGGVGRAPIYDETCYLAKTPVLFECTPPAVNTNLSNGSGGVTATFVDSKTIDCNGKTVGSIEGSQTIESSKGGGALSAVNASEASKLAEAEWGLSGVKLTESIATSWHGEFEASNANNGAAVACEDTAEGSVSAGLGGEVTKVTMSKCVGVKTCEAGSTIEVSNLPWHTELVHSEGLIHVVLVGGGKGAPSYKVTCDVGKLQLTEECTAPAINTKTANGSGGVTATFADKKTSECNGTKNVGSIEGTQTIASSKGGKLEVF
jgi:hypothetical protein